MSGKPSRARKAKAASKAKVDPITLSAIGHSARRGRPTQPPPSCRRLRLTTRRLCGACWMMPELALLTSQTPPPPETPLLTSTRANPR